MSAHRITYGRGARSPVSGQTYRVQKRSTTCVGILRFCGSGIVKQPGKIRDKASKILW